MLRKGHAGLYKAPTKEERKAKRRERSVNFVSHHRVSSSKQIGSCPLRFSGKPNCYNWEITGSVFMCRRGVCSV